MRWKLFLLLVLLVPCWVIAAGYDIDLVNLYAAAQFANQDLSRIYATNGSLGRFFYGPISIVFLKPLGNFSYETVKWFWICLQTVSYAIFWFGLHRLYPILGRRVLPWIVVFIMAINPIHNNYQSNNIQLMLAAVLVLAEIFTFSLSPFLLFTAGVLCALTATVKMFPLFLVAYYFFAKPRMVRFGLIAGVAFSVAIPYLVFGLDNGNLLFHDFLSNLTNYDRENSLTLSGDILCLPSLIARLMTPLAGTGISAGLVTKISILGISGIFFGWVLLKRREIESSPRFAIHMWAMACALMVFLNPSSRPHYFIFYVPAFASLFEYAEQKASAKTLGLLTAISCLLIAFTAEGVVGKRINNILELQSAPTWGMVILCAILAWQILRTKPEEGIRI